MMRKVRDEARTLPRVSRTGALDLLVLLLAFLFHTAFFAGSRRFARPTS
jgi:hypothetical protein